MNTRNISGMLLCCTEKANQACKKTEPQARTLIILLVCGFVAGMHILSFAVIGHDKINIPEIIISSVHGFSGCTVKDFTLKIISCI